MRGALSAMLAVWLASGHVGAADEMPFHWQTRADAPRITDRNVGPVAGQLGMRFDHAQRHFVDLGQGADGSFKLNGPVTIQTVFKLHSIPPAKVALVSKWQTRAGGRSYELGVTPMGWVFFTVSASGNWDRNAVELLSTRMLRAGGTYHVAAVYVPGKRMTLFINGHESGQIDRRVPTSIFDSTTPLWLGNRFGNPAACGFDGWIATVDIERAARAASAIRKSAAPLPLTDLPERWTGTLAHPIDLSRVRAKTTDWYERLAAPGQPYGAYRLLPGRPPDMYASADVAWIRWIMDDLRLSAAQRRQWIDFIQAQQNSKDGTYRHITGHCPAHAFCHATGALNMLGGKQRWAPRFLERYRNTQGIAAWLDQIDWVHQWGASHDIWGAGVPLACSPQTPDAWRTTLFEWLDNEVDPATGFWRRGQAARSPLESLGGAFHIWPIYAALGRPLPYPERVLDHVIKLQHEDGSFDGGFGYGNMDGIWVLEYLLHQTTYRHADVVAALQRNLDGLVQLYNNQPPRFYTDAHSTESRIASLAILQDALPDQFADTGQWRNPWHERRLFAIEVSGER